MALRVFEGHDMPSEPEPVLAKIEKQADLGKSEWSEVVYHDGKNWKSYSGSNTFEDGEQVKSWVYVSEVWGDGR